MPARLKETRLTIAGKKYKYYDLGSGKPVFILHGLAGSKEAILPLFNLLRKKYRCIIPDLPGHNGIPLEGITTEEEYVDYLLNLISHLNLEPKSLIGFSFGGLISLKIAEKLTSEKNPLLVVLWSVPLHNKTSGISLLARFCISLIMILPREIITSLSHPVLLSMLGLSISPEAINALTDFDKNAIPFYYRLSSTKFSLNHHPLLIIHDPKDIFIRKTLANQQKKELLPGQNLVIIESGGHFGAQKAIEKVQKEIDKFLKSHS